MTTSVTYTEETDPYCCSPDEATALLAGAPWRRFGVIGDSLSAGIGDSTPGYRDAGWSDRVADALRSVQPDLRYLNTAVIGATTVETIDGQFDQMREFGSELLDLPCGATDLMRRQPDFQQIERELRRLYTLASATGAQLTAFTLGRAFVVPVFPDWTDRVRRVNDLTRSLAAEHGAAVIDMWAHPINDRTNLVSADRIHFSTSGQAVMAAEVAKTLGGLTYDRPYGRRSGAHRQAPPAG